MPSPPAAAPSVPRFTCKKIRKRLDSVIGKDFTGTVYSLRGYPGLSVKEVLLDGLDRSSVDALRLELATISNLSHPGILRYYQIVEDEGLIYIVTDRHDKTLERLLTEHRRRNTPISVTVVLSILRQVTAALAYLHSVSDADAGQPICCDLRPANILVSGDGEHFIIADLGLYRDALWSESTFAGTAGYVAPETLLRNEASPASDVWGLGVILYELATLRRPDFLGDREPAEVFVDGWRPDLSAVADDLTKSILEKILVLEPEKRLTARELCEMLTVPDIPVSELGHRYAVLKYECNSLKVALNSANARIALLEDELRAKADRTNTRGAALENRSRGVDSLGHEPRIKITRSDALEDQVKTLTDKFAQFNGETNARDTQTGLLLLPRLIHAAHTNNTEAVRVLLEEGVRTGQRDEQRMTALMHAAQQGHAGPVELLVEKEKGLRDKNGWTALMHAVQKGSLEVIKILLDHEKGMRDKQNHNALYHALKNGHLEAAKVIIPYEDPTNEDGVTALMRAAARGDAEMVELLVPIQKGLKDKNGDTAFMHALRNKHIDTAMFLGRHEDSSWTPLMHAAADGDVGTVKKHLSDKDAQDNDSEIALLLAARGMHKDVVELLDPTDDYGVTALMRAADRNDLATVKALAPLQAGQRTSEHFYIWNWSIRNGTALMRAAVRGHPDCVKLLLEKEGGMQSSGEWTALMWAAKNGHSDCVKLLLEREGGMKDSTGWTALISAAEHGHPDCVKLLVKRRRERDASGWTDLMCAACLGDADAVKNNLQQAGMGDNYGQTALMWAARNGHLECVRLLLEKEGGMQDSDGQTALMRAAWNDKIECAKLLLEEEGGMQSTHGGTALICAVRNNKLGCVRLLAEREKHIRETYRGNTALDIANRMGNKEIIAILSK